ncbi:MAG: hypothetical protein EOP84_37200 [Verrucomicrobiaceae bacterium]|nr:MAG: hypothetical protein EOP84_37200 [Verrucomicrobiaceae bacterium]
MHSLHSFLRVGSLPFLTAAAMAAEPLFVEDFTKATPDSAPQGLMIMSGGFTVKEEDGNKFLELPGAPLDTFGALFGPTPPSLEASASARFLGTKKGRKFPTFGISLHGVGGYRLQVSPAKKALEIYKGDQPIATVPFEWESGAWTHARIQVRQKGDGAVVEGKAWTAGGAEPEKWLITHEETTAPKPGRAGLWGSPYSGTPIGFDDLKVEAAK